jgi:creatinine amidohydrolase
MAVQWAYLTESEISDLLLSGTDAVLLPVGATEQHGPHLATGTDSIIAEKLAWAVSDQTQVPVLPNLPYGCSLGHSHFWKGTLSLDPKILIDTIVHIGNWVYSNGFKKIFIINGHVTNHAPIRCALEILRSQYNDLMIAQIDTGKINSALSAEFSKDADDWHANKAETAIIQAIEPSAVRNDLIATADDPDRTKGLVFAHPVNRTSLNGVTGKPSEATPQYGKELWTKMIQAVCDIVQKGLIEQPPLAQNYHEK